jgi:hypothetical protein
LVVGLAAMVALVLGVSTMAFAANGDNWTLGQLNSATAITKLAGSGGVDGPMLQITNDDSGSDDTALDLNVQSGEPPMTVDSQRKVRNLNADKLDGMSSSAFASYERVVIVSPVGTNAQNGQALLDALASINDASASKPYLLYLEPDTYDLGNRSLQMKQWVDIQGSGELNTTITSGISSEDGSAATVEGADNTEMRFLTAQNTSTGDQLNQRTAILNDSGSPRMSHVSAKTIGGNPDVHIGVSNQGDSQPTMTDVTATASGSRNPNTAVQLVGGSATSRQSKLSAIGPGQNGALENDGGGSSAKVAVSQLVGGIQSPASALQCFDNYDENMTAVNCRSGASR